MADYPYYTISTKRPTDEYGIKMTFQFGLDDDSTLTEGAIQAVKDYFESIVDHQVIFTEKYEVTYSSF